MKYLSADIETIAKATATAAAMERILGVKPELDIRDDHVRLFYYPSDLEKAQNSFRVMIDRKEPGPVRIDYLPIVLPVLVKKYFPHITLGALLLFLLSSKK